MKIRDGFVSNSSSTSFCIVGISAYNFKTHMREAEMVNELAKADGCNEMGGEGYSEGETLIFIGGEGYGGKGDSYKPDYAGIEAESELIAGKTVPQLASEFVARAKALGVEVPIEQVTLYYGECSDGC